MPDPFSYFRAKGPFGENDDFSGKEELVGREWFGKTFITQDDLDTDKSLQEKAWHVLFGMGSNEGRSVWVAVKPSASVAGTSGSRAITVDITAGSKALGVFSDGRAVQFEGAPGMADIPWEDDGSSVYEMKVETVLTPSDVSLDRDGVIRYSRWSRRVGFMASSPNFGVNSVTDLGGSIALNINNIVDPWPQVGTGPRTRPVVCWKQNASTGEHLTQQGAASPDPDVAIYVGTAVSSGVNVTVTVPHTFGQGGSPSTDALDYQCVVLGPEIAAFTAYSKFNLLVGTFDAAAGTFDFDDVAFVAPDLELLADRWLNVNMTAGQGDITFDHTLASAYPWRMTKTSPMEWETDTDAQDILWEVPLDQLGVHRGAITYSHLVLKNVRFFGRVDSGGGTGHQIDVEVFRVTQAGVKTSLGTGTVDEDTAAFVIDVALSGDLEFDVDADTGGSNERLVLQATSSVGSGGTPVYKMRSAVVRVERVRD